MESDFVEIRAKILKKPPRGTWAIGIEVRTRGLVNEICILEPYLCSLAEWRKMIRGETTIDYIYGTQGESSIEKLGTELYEIRVRPYSGICFMTKLPAKALSEQLEAVLREAEDRGLFLLMPPCDPVGASPRQPERRRSPSGGGLLPSPRQPSPRTQPSPRRTSSVSSPRQPSPRVNASPRPKGQ